ncbi:TetR/AcrR family transcriptional regulator [Peribacillus asahii]|uniref:TetR/AcrR family transcriptional regulator n=1 Tax=Peribacillus asahii TaxID=228899 RepID=UPI00207AD490|nr:TetR/AcrR family transcriptional regulator [Peribacillus asahii]USK70213.1 TetR/AcrR family transcriptional regulator [Peribacillus asahii]
MSKENLLDAIIAQTKLSKKQTTKQRKIVETAVKLFAEKGYANTSTSEIAKSAQVAEGTIFRHYGTKDNLLLSVILPFIKDALPTMAEAAFSEIMIKNAACFEDFLKALIKNRLLFIKENKEIFQVVVKELLYNDELRKELQPYFFENIMQRISKVIKMFKERGELIDIPSDTLLNMIFNVVGSYFVSRFVLQLAYSDMDEEAEVENLVRFIMDGIRKPSQGM